MKQEMQIIISMTESITTEGISVNIECIMINQIGASYAKLVENTIWILVTFINSSGPLNYSFGTVTFAFPSHCF